MGFYVRPDLTKENIFKRITSYDVFMRYCKNFKEVGSMFKSEFRNDKNASCCIEYINGDLLYKDFGEDSYRCVDYVGRKFSLSFYNSLKRINEDFKLGLGYRTNDSNEIIQPRLITSLPKFEEKQRTVIKIKKRNWTKEDIKYWNSYDIPIKLLEEYNVKSISHYWLINNKGEREFVNNNIGFSYDYYWHKDIFLRKLYFPHANSEGKWISNVDYTIIQGWNILPKEGGDILFITKSFKDVMIFKLLNYWAVAPNNERAFIPEQVFKDKLQIRWKRIIIWYDNDDTGIEGAEKFSKKFEIEYYHNPLDTPKDPSDFVQLYGLQVFKELVENTIYNG